MNEKPNECQRKVHLLTIFILSCGGCVRKVTLTEPSTISLTQRDQSADQPVVRTHTSAAYKCLVSVCGVNVSVNVVFIYHSRHVSGSTSETLIFNEKKKINPYAQVCGAC